jgi:outer membrane protein
MPRTVRAQKRVSDSHDGGILMKTSTRLLLAVMGFAAVSATGAMAADLGGSYKDAPVYETEWGAGWMIRGRILGVIPDEDSSDWVVGGRATPGLDLSVDNSIVPELDFTYFFNKNLAIEAIAGVTPHTITGEKGLAGNGDIGDVWLLPPTVLLQYHFDLGNGIKPYVGAGVNYTVFFNEDASGPYNNLKLDNAFGFAAQAGVDIHLQGNWFLNVDVKKIWLDTDATVNLGTTPVSTHVDLDPLIIGVGLGYRFGGHPAPLK